MHPHFFPRTFAGVEEEGDALVTISGVGIENVIERLIGDDASLNRYSAFADRVRAEEGVQGYDVGSALPARRARAPRVPRSAPRQTLSAFQCPPKADQRSSFGSVG